MKNIESISIWDNGQNKEANILNAYAVNVNLGTSATFYYTLSNEAEQLAQGNLTMSGDDYQEWDADGFAWGWIAAQLNLTIVGDYVKPEVEPIVDQTEPQPIEETEE
jgi:hypothetical protein